MSDSQIQVIDAQTEDNLTGIVIEGNPYLYWLRVYKALGLTPNHARKVIERLEEGTHFISFSRTDFKEKYPTVYKSYTVIDTRASSVIFLTPEGYNRAIMEISTGYMDDPVVAAAIDQKKDHIANIYTRYQQGEVLSLAADQHKKLPGEVVQPVNEIALAEAKLRYYNTAKKIAISMGADRRSSNIVMIEKIKEEFPDIHPFMAMIPDEKVCNSPDDAVLTRQEVSDILKTDVHILEERIVKAGWVTKTIYGWLPTPRGTKYLKPDPHAGEKKTWYDIRFSLEAIRLLKEEFEQRLITGGCLSSGCSRSILPVTGNERSKNRRLGV
jgi:hypothetical protein